MLTTKKLHIWCCTAHLWGQHGTVNHDYIVTNSITFSKPLWLFLKFCKPSKLLNFLSH